jgi:hypothetical protein
MISSSRTCPECGTNEIKVLTPMTESQPAYLCENGHFFLEPQLVERTSDMLRVS